MKSITTLTSRRVPIHSSQGKRRGLDPRLAFVAQPADSPKFDNAVRSAILGGATSIQLRAKNCPTRQFIQLARRTQSIVNETCTAASTIPLIINDRLDVALAVGADGIHVGQDDMPLEEVRNLVGPDFIVGSTVSNPAQAKESELHGADYLGTDAIFSTASKPDSLPLGISTFADICASVSIPVLGIGGINAMNCADVIGAGASGVAVISAIQNADNPLAAARLLRQTVDHHLPHYSREWAHKAADILQQLRQKKPLVQHLTNYVVMNQTANISIAAGASPVMTHEADLTPNAGAALLNIGTLDEEWVKRYHAVARSANASGVPLILDPVGAGATTLRTRTATELLSRYSFACVKGNTGEMGALAGDTSARVKGVDTAYKPQNPHEVVLRVARRFKTVAVMTGKVDYISDGHNIVEIYNNSSLLGNTTGSGCSAASVIAAFVACQKCVHDVSPLEAVSAGLSVYLIAAEKAFKRLDALNGPASYWSAVVDELFKLTKDDVIERARIRLVPHKM